MATPKARRATCLGVYFEGRTGALISHGELEIARFSAEGAILWRRPGADIFTGAFALNGSARAGSAIERLPSRGNSVLQGAACLLHVAVY